MPRHVASLLVLAAGGPDGCDPARELAYEKIAELDDKIAQLGAMRQALEQLVRTCERPRQARECPLLHSLDEPPPRHPAADPPPRRARR